MNLLIFFCNYSLPLSGEEGEITSASGKSMSYIEYTATCERRNGKFKGITNDVLGGMIVGKPNPTSDHPTFTL
jgi:hypothetical protein